MKEQKEEPIIERRNDIIDFDELLVEDGKKSSLIEVLDKSEPKTEIKSKSMIARLKLWEINTGFLIVSILVSIYWNSLHNVKYLSVAQELGAITGPLILFFLLPLLLTYLVKGIAKHSKSDLGIKGYIITFFIVWCILVVQGLRGAYLEKNIQNQSSVMDTKFLYKPQGSEYSVVFENKPTISSAITPIGSYVLKGENAEVDMPDYGYLERVEFCLLDKKFLDIFTQDFIYKFLNEYSKINGLIYPQMTFPENKTGNIGELRANKEIIDNKGNKRILTFVAKVYLKGETMFVTFVGADSKNFPTPEIERFWSSIQ